jgi:FAD dependent oxidoreductase
MLGQYVLQEADLVGSAPSGRHGRVWLLQHRPSRSRTNLAVLPEYLRIAAVFNEGYVSVAVPPYLIPLRSLRPRQEDCDNLLVAVCVSASHVAFGSLRMEPT